MFVNHAYYCACVLKYVYDSNLKGAIIWNIFKIMLIPWVEVSLRCQNTLTHRQWCHLSEHHSVRLHMVWQFINYIGFWPTSQSVNENGITWIWVNKSNVHHITCVHNVWNGCEMFVWHKLLMNVCYLFMFFFLMF